MTEIEEACFHLLRVWAQYGEEKERRFKGHLYLGHGHMKAGEYAGEFLIARGYAVDYGEGILLTDAGEALADREAP